MTEYSITLTQTPKSQLKMPTTIVFILLVCSHRLKKLDKSRNINPVPMCMTCSALLARLMLPLPTHMWVLI